MIRGRVVPVVDPRRRRMVTRVMVVRLRDMVVFHVVIVVFCVCGLVGGRVVVVMTAAGCTIGRVVGGRVKGWR